MPYIAQASCVFGFPWFNQILLHQLPFLQPSTLKETQAIHTQICNNIKSSLGDLSLKLIVAALSAACSRLEL